MRDEYSRRRSTSTAFSRNSRTFRVSVRSTPKSRSIQLIWS